MEDTTGYSLRNFNDDLFAASPDDLSREELIMLVKILQQRLLPGCKDQGSNLPPPCEENSAQTARLVESEKKYRYLFENAPVGVFRSTSGGSLIDANRALAGILGFSNVRETLEKIYDLGSQAYADPSVRLDYIDRLRKNGEVENFEVEGVRKDGSHIWVSLNARISQWTSADDFIIEGFVADITDKKLFEDKIIRQNKELKELNATKDKFFSIIAHDLRNPFNGLQALSMLLVKHYDEYDKNQAIEILELINQSAERGVRLLENLLEWSRVQVGRIEYTPVFFTLADMVNDTIALMGNQAAKKQIKLNSFIGNNIRVYADRNMVYTVLRNLISNAIKFTFTRGEVNIKVEWADKDHIKVIVSDNGMGIVKESQERLFKLGENFSTKGTANESGTGLGLILCKDFVEKNGGRIWVESEYEKGSDFIFTIPVHNRLRQKQKLAYDATT